MKVTSDVVNLNFTVDFIARQTVGFQLMLFLFNDPDD